VTKDEKIAESYLENLGFQKLEFEPNGIITPEDYTIFIPTNNNTELTYEFQITL